MELVDVVNVNDEVVGSAPKDEVRQKGLFSRVAFIILVNANNELLLQQRKSTKKTYPLYWSGSAAGHVQSGETYQQAALRELREELGVDVALTELGKFISYDDKEIVAVFIGRCDGPYTLEEATIELVMDFSLQQLRDALGSMKMTSYLETAIPMVEAYLTGGI